MRIAYLDTVAGIAGDMTLGACIDAGVDLEDLRSRLARVPLEGYELQAVRVKKHGIAAVHVDVIVGSEQRRHRHLKDILSIIEGSSMEPRAAGRARAVFSAIAAAEAHVHGTTVDRVHFHEVGAVDSIVDIIGTALCLEILGIERIYSSPVKVGGGGEIQTEHGLMPVPTPATLELLKGYPTVLTGVGMELTTPTGAALVAALSAGVLDAEVFRPLSVGYGAGTRDVPGLPNLLRIIVADMPSAEETDEVLIVETDIDDMNPQIYPVVLDALLASGARDAYLTPVVMKKGRPGIHLTAVVDPPLLDECVRLLLRQTSTIGVRSHRAQRRKLPREERVVRTSFGPVRVKVVDRDGSSGVAAEFDDCRRIAEERGIPLREVMQAVDREINAVH
jgi:uncharacterized protein (TIGR00299 family) protein